MDHAVTRGITLIDTAAMYTSGASEQIVGAWLKSRKPQPGSMMIATKIYPPFTAGPIATNVAACAKRLGIETIDLLYLHKWDEGATTPDALQALDRLVRSGRVRALGVSNFTAAQLRQVLDLQKALGLSQFQIIQNCNNLAVREVDQPLAALCAERGLAIVTYSPIGAGFLTGKHRAGVQAGSRFDVAPGHQDIYFKPEPERRLAKLERVATRTGMAMPHLALAWALHRKGVDSVLVGGRTPAQLDQAFAALAFDDPALFAELESD